MKKLLGSVLALAFVVMASRANAELLKNFKFDGSVEMDATSANNVLDFNTKASDRIGAAQTRVMLGMDWDLLDDVHSKVSMYKNDQVYGANTDNNGNSGAQSLNDIQSAVYVSQAYFKIDKVFGYVDSTFGRQYYGDAGDLIAAYGPKVNQYGMNVTSIDGARFDWNGESAYATGLYFRPANTVNTIGHTGTALNSQQDVMAIMGGIKGNENYDAKVSLWNQETHGVQATGVNAPGQNDNLYIADVKVKGKAAGAYGSVEVGYNFGENRSNAAVAPQVSERYDGKAVLANLGYKADLEGIGTINPWAEGGIGSGNGTTNAKNHNEDFQTIATDYRPGALYGRFDSQAAVQLGGAGSVVSSNGLTNRKLWGVGVKATPSALNKLTVGAAYWDFNVNTIQDNTQYVGSKGNRHIGDEIDLIGEWKHSENVSLVGTLADFQTGGLLKNEGASAPAFMAACDVKVKF
jgi:hypothetical protein